MASPSKNPVDKKDENDGTTHSDADITQTKDWVTLVNPMMVDAGHSVTHCNLAVVASLLQNVLKMQSDMAKDMKMMEREVAKLRSDVRALLRLNGEEEPGENEPGL